MPNSVKLKSIPSDFIVSESLILPTQFQNSHNELFQYAKLTKSRYTTFEAVGYIAKTLDISTNSIGFAGLKDEDGITEQYVSLPTKTSIKYFTENQDNFPNNKFIKLNYIGSGSKPLSAGQLCGNNFKIIVRNLNKELAEQIYTKKQYVNFFINYYETQRFGLPGSLKNTHILGEKLINKEYDKALLLLSEQQSPESDKAKQYKGLAEDFFNSLDLRILAFYKSSFFSYKWNETLKKLLKDKARSKLSEYEEDGILYLYTNSIQNKINLLKEAIEIPYYKFRQQGDTIQKLPSTRPSLIQNIITCNNIDEDIYNKDKWFCELVFFLPSGCYATVATQQFIFDMIKL